MASQALTARFMMTCSICMGSARTSHKSGWLRITSSMSSRIKLGSIRSISPTTILRSSTRGESTCLRPNASNC